MTRAGRAGQALLDTLMASLVLSVMGLAAMGLLSASAQDTGRLRTDVLLRSFAMNVTDRLAAGEARALFGLAPSPSFERARSLTRAEIDAAAGPELIALLGQTALRVDVSLSSDPTPLGSHRLRSGLVTCTVSWQRPGTLPRTFTVSTLTDSL